MASAEQFIDSVLVKWVARVSMIAATPLLGILVSLAVYNINIRFDHQDYKLDVLNGRVTHVEAAAAVDADTSSAIDKRLVTLEEGAKRGRSDREAYQAQSTSDMRDVRQALVVLSNNVAALTATVQSLRDQQHAAVEPRDQFGH